MCVCVARHPNPDIHRSMVWVGTHELKKPSSRYHGILHFMSHPEYKALTTGFQHDIALIKLKKKVRFSDLVKAVTLPGPDDITPPSSECWIAGWGNIGTSGESCMASSTHCDATYQSHQTAYRQQVEMLN